MAYGKVSASYWHDKKIRALSERARYLMLYLMSCPHGNRLGLFLLDPGYVAADLSTNGDEPVIWTRNDVAEGLTELRDRGRIRWDIERRVLFVRHYIRHNTLINQSVAIGAINELRNVPDTPLLKDLLEAIIEHKTGPKGQTRAYLDDLEEEIRRRCTAFGITGVDTEEIHNAGHNEEQARRAQARATVPSRSSPLRSDPVLTDPTLPSDGEHRREDDLTIEDGPTADEPLEGGTRDSASLMSPPDEQPLGEQITSSLPQARQNIVRIHGDTEEPVRIGGHDVGVGIEIAAFRRLCEAERDPPHIIAAAIAYIPEVCELERPVSLARWGAADDGPEIYERCVGRAYQDAPAAPVGASVKRLSRMSAHELADRKKLLRGQVEELRGGAG